MIPKEYLDAEYERVCKEIEDLEKNSNFLSRWLTKKFMHSDKKKLDSFSEKIFSVLFFIQKYFYL
jgi:hypothetical protein